MPTRTAREGPSDVERRGSEFRQLEPGRHGSFGIVLMHRRPAEVGHHAITEQLRDVSAQVTDRVGCGLVVPLHDNRQFLGIEAMGNLGRTDDVAEQDAYLSALGATRHHSRGSLMVRCTGRGSDPRLPQNCDRLQQALAIG